MPPPALGEWHDREHLQHLRARGVERELRSGDVGHDQVEQPPGEAAGGPGAERVQRGRGEAAERDQRVGADRLAGLLVRPHRVATPGAAGPPGRARRPAGPPGTTRPCCPARRSLRRPRTRTGTIARTVLPVTGSPRVSSQLRSAPETVASTDVVDRAAVRLADPLVVVQVGAGHAEPALLPDRHVQRGARRGPRGDAGHRGEAAGRAGDLPTVVRDVEHAQPHRVDHRRRAADQRPDRVEDQPQHARLGGAAIQRRPARPAESACVEDHLADVDSANRRPPSRGGSW